ncbi:heparinase II/III family protein [Roseateles saccharophilus]|uniref:Heparinase II/III-like protein n=2 Tax=Roseateles saccharophilus TaxID=304 RepID=A0A4R3UQX5_ROSSA|nr:heparinase II/III-like protein [Roseateles saccharophilus]
MSTTASTPTKPAATAATTAIAVPAVQAAVAKPTTAALAATPVVAATTPAPPARNSPLWNAPAPPAKAGVLGMALLTSINTGLFNGARTAREDWPTLVNRVKSDGGVASWVKAEQTRVDAWIARNFERADLIGGWINDYVDANGMALSWSPTDPEPPNGTTDAQKKFKGAWVARGRDYNIAQMQAAARIYRATGNTKYAEWAAKQLDFYARQYTLWPVSTVEGRSTMYRQGLDEAVAVAPLADTARLLDSYAGMTRTATWKNQFFMPLASNLKSTSAPLSNIQLWHASAIAIIAMRYKDSALLGYAIDDPAGIRANMASGLTVDNLWIEGGFAYNTYVVNCLSLLLVAADLEGFGDRFLGEANAALRMVLTPMEYHFDNGSLPNPGDSTSAQVMVNDLAHWYLFRTMPTYWGIAKATAWRTWESLLDPPKPNASATAPIIPTPNTKNFESLRWSILRAGNWQAFVRYGAMKPNHAPDEELNFELYDGSTPIAYDPGTTNYGSPLHQGYFVRGPAANAPLVDGDGQTKWAPGTLISFDAANSALTAEQTAFQADASARRSYRLTSSGFVEQSTITIPSGKTRRVGMAFSSTCDMVPGAGVSAASGLPALPAVTAFGYWSNTTTYTTTASWQLTLKCPGNKNYVMKVWGPGAQRLYIGKAPNTPVPATRNSLYYEVSAASAVFESSVTAAP